LKQAQNVSQIWQDAETLAAGLRVPKPYGDTVILDIVRNSGGRSLAVSDAELSLGEWVREEWMTLCLEGASVMAAYDRLVNEGFMNATDRVVLFNTGTGLKYTDVIAEAFGLKRPA